VVRIHAGEPLFSFNSLEIDVRHFVQILYAGIKLDLHNLLNLQSRSDEHGFETYQIHAPQSYFWLRLLIRRYIVVDVRGFSLSIAFEL